MATIKQRLLKKNSSGTYDTIHLETSMDCLTGILPVSKGGTGMNSLESLTSTIVTSALSSYIKSGKTSTTTSYSLSVNLSAQPQAVIIVQTPWYITERILMATRQFSHKVANSSAMPNSYITLTVTSTGFIVTTTSDLTVLLSTPFYYIAWM